MSLLLWFALTSVTILTLSHLQNWGLLSPCFCQNRLGQLEVAKWCWNLRVLNITDLFLVRATVWCGLAGDRWGGWEPSLLLAVTKDPEWERFQLPGDDPHGAHTSVLAGVGGETHRGLTLSSVLGLISASYHFGSRPLHRISHMDQSKYYRAKKWLSSLSFKEEENKCW